MTNFNTLLKTALQMSSLSIRNLSSVLDIDRTRLQKILSGDRGMDYDTFEMLIRHLSVPDELLDELRISFAMQYYGKNDYEIIELLISQLSHMADYEKQFVPLELSDKDSIINTVKAYCTSENQISFIKKINDIVFDELNSDEPAIYTNFSFRQTPVRFYLLNILRSADYFIDFRHICFNTLNDTDTAHIQNYLYSYEFAGYGYNTYYYSVNNEVAMAPFTPIPYFLMTKQHAVFFSSDMEFFILENYIEKSGYLHTYFNNIYKVCMPFSVSMASKDDFAKFTNIVSQCSVGSTFDISNNICLSSHLTKDILMDAIPDCIEFKEYLAMGINDFFTFFRKNKLTMTFSHESLLDFINNDIIPCDYHHVTFDVLALSHKHKLALMESLYNCIQHGNFEIYMLKTDKIKLPGFFHTNTFCNDEGVNKLTLSFNIKTYSPQFKQRVISVALTADPVLSKHLHNLGEFIVHSPYIYSSSHSANILQYSIEYYKNAST